MINRFDKLVIFYLNLRKTISENNQIKEIIIKNENNQNILQKTEND
jgi:hypothetical protein